MLLCLLLLVGLINCETIRNLKVHRSINLHQQVVMFTDDIVFVNYDVNPVREYKYVIDPSIERVRLQVNDRITKQDNRTYLIHFTEAILPKQQFVLSVFGIVLDQLSISNGSVSVRYIQYKENFLYYSAYKTDVYSATYELVEKGELVQTEPKLHGNRTRLYNDVNNIKPFSYVPLYVTYINNLPFYLVNYLERKIDISHFGFIMVEDKVTVTNKGPKSKEPYVSVPLRVRTKLHTILPELAFNIKLFDEIGNNSKSQLFYTEYETILAFETRYELLMSWRTVYIVQYTVPAYPYLRRANDTYVLQMPLVDNILPGAFIQSAKTMVYLPEDSKLIQVNATEDYVELGESERVTTALSPRREVVVFNSVELVNGFAPNLYLVYSRGPVRVFKPAFYIITYIEIVFLCYLFISYVQPMMALKKP